MIYSLILLNKPVINSDKNEKIGRVKGYVINPEEKRVIALILTPDAEKGSLDIIPYSAVKSVYDNAVIIENLPSPIPISDMPDILNVFLKDIAVIGAQILTDTGMLAGTVRDFAFTEKNGELAQLSVTPERPDITRIDAKYILKITQQRIMVAGKALEDQPPAPSTVDNLRAKAERAVATPKTEPQPSPKEPAPETKSAEAEPTPTPAQEKTPDKAPDAPAPQPTGSSESSDIKDVLQEYFMEMTRILVGRLNAIETSDSLANLKNEIIEALRTELASPKTESDDESPTLELLLEEKIKRFVSGPLGEIKLEIDNLKATITSSLDSNDRSAEIKVEPPDLSSVYDSIDTLEKKLSENIGILSKNISAIAMPSFMPVQAAMKELGETVESAAGKIPSREEIRKQLSDQADLFEKRSAALHKTYMAEIDRRMDNIGKQLSGYAPRFEDALKSLQDTFTRELERISLIFKEFPLNSAPAVDIEKLESSISNIFEDFRDQFATQLAVELDEKNSVKQTFTERRFIDSLERLIEPVRRSIAESAVKDDLNAKVEDIIRRIDNTQGAIVDKLESRLAERADFAEKEASNIQDIFRRLENKLVELRELNSSSQENLDNVRKHILDEIRSYTGTTLKPEDLMIVREWLREVVPEIGDNAAEKARESLSAASNRLDNIASQIKSQLDFVGQAVGDTRNDVRGTIEEFILKLRGDILTSIDSIKDDSVDQKFENIRNTVLDEIRSYSNRNLKQEDLAVIREWLKEIVPEIGETAAAKAGSTLDAALDELENAAALIKTQLESVGATVGSSRDDFHNAFDDFSNKLRDEILSFSNINLKREDLSIVREWLREIVPEIGETTAEKAGSSLGAVSEDLKNTAAQIKNQLESIGTTVGSTRDDIRKTIVAFSTELREHIITSIEAGKENLAGVRDIDELRVHVESQIGNVMDRLAERVENRLDQRDRYFEEGVQAVLNSVEKLLSRGARFDFDNIFSGGGLISNLFSGGKSESPMKLTGRTAPQSRSSQKGSEHVDPQIKRFAYLLGKKVHREITDTDGNILAGPGDIVDEALIQTTREKQRTLELIRAVDFKD